MCAALYTPSALTSPAKFTRFPVEGVVCRFVVASCEMSGGSNCNVFFSIAARTITALTVVSFGRQLLDLNIVGGNKTKNTKQQQNPQTKHKQQHQTKQTPKKSEMDVSETVKRSKLPLSEPLLGVLYKEIVIPSNPEQSSVTLRCEFYVQGAIQAKLLSLAKVKGAVNCANFLTKHPKERHGGAGSTALSRNV